MSLKTLSYLFACLCFLSLFSCKAKTKTTIPPDSQDFFSRNDAEIRNVRNVDTLLNILNTTSAIEGMSIGFAGEPSSSYAYFDQLQKIANDSVFLRLTYHDNPKMRVYGMWGLRRKNPRLAEKQLDRFFHDQTEVEYHDGCVRMKLPIYQIATIDDIDIEK